MFLGWPWNHLRRVLEVVRSRLVKIAGMNTGQSQDVGSVAQKDPGIEIDYCQSNYDCLKNRVVCLSTRYHYHSIRYIVILNFKCFNSSVAAICLMNLVFFFLSSHIQCLKRNKVNVIYVISKISLWSWTIIDVSNSTRIKIRFTYYLLYYELG